MLKLQNEPAYGRRMSTTLTDLLIAFGIRTKKTSVPVTAEDIAAAMRVAEQRRAEAEAAVTKADKAYRSAVVNRDHSAADAAEKDRKLAQREADALILETQELEGQLVELVAAERDALREQLLTKHRTAARRAFDTLSERLEAALAASEDAIEVYRQAQAELGAYSAGKGAPNTSFAGPLARGSVEHWRRSLLATFEPVARPSAPPAGMVAIRALRSIAELSLMRDDIAGVPLADAARLVQAGAAVFVEPGAGAEQASDAPEASAPPEPDDNGRIAVHVLKPIDQGIGQGMLTPGDTAALPADAAIRLVGEGRAEFAEVAP